MLEAGGAHSSTSELVPGKVPRLGIRCFLKSQPIPARMLSPLPLVHSRAGGRSLTFNLPHKPEGQNELNK